MDPFINIVCKCQAHIEDNGFEISWIKHTQFLRRFADLHENSPLFVCPTTKFFCTKKNCFLSTYFIFSHKSIAVKIWAAL